MENFGFKGLLVTLYQRVVVSQRSSLIGLGILVLGIAAEYLVQSPNKIIATVAGLITSVLLLIKDKPKPSAPA